ncbi:MAG: hypothetical protein A2Y12_02390 [Planctomycetes bacterium GWF2_42_9]|nr:MAG: hypothetical protein A2Y12_02390 [Planctomycetes bacterium GWF2_42_9]
MISIVALLLSILMPSLGKARKQAQQVVCMSNLKQMGVLITMFGQDHDNQFWSGWHAGYQDKEWMVELYYYDKNLPTMVKCPTTKKVWNGEKDGTFGMWTAGPAKKSIHFPSPPVREDFPVMYGSYAVNWLVSNVPADVTPFGGFQPADFIRRMDVSGSSRVPVLVDGNFWLTRPGIYDTPADYKGQVPFYR